MIHAALFVAHFLKSKKHYQEAERYAALVQDGNGAEKEEAKALLREIRLLVVQ